MDIRTVYDEATENREPHYEPFGWHHWPEHLWMSFQCRRAELVGVLSNMQCPYLIMRGGHDVPSVERATKAYEHAKESGWTWP